MSSWTPSACGTAVQNNSNRFILMKRAHPQGRAKPIEERSGMGVTSRFLALEPTHLRPVHFCPWGANRPSLLKTDRGAPFLLPLHTVPPSPAGQGLTASLDRGTGRQVGQGGRTRASSPYELITGLCVASSPTSSVYLQKTRQPCSLQDLRSEG